MKLDGFGLAEPEPDHAAARASATAWARDLLSRNDWLLLDVNSMSDLFHEQIPESFIHDVFTVMRASRHTYQILTKRPERMVDVLYHLSWMTEPNGRGGYVAYRGTPGSYVLPNVWLGVSIEQDRWVQRADLLRATPAAVRFISAEPLLEPLPALSLVGIDWLIAGAESGRGARPMDDDWVRDLRDRTKAAGGAFFFKQRSTCGGVKREHPVLDGVTWEEFPG